MKTINIRIFTVLLTGMVFVLGGCKDDFTAPAPLSGTAIGGAIATNSEFNLFTAVANKTGQFNSLNDLNSGLFTVFAPNDAAFVTYFAAAYPAYFGPIAPNTEDQVITFLGQLSQTPPANVPTLTTFISTTVPIINYHLMSSKLTQDKITGNQVFATLNGARLSISKGTSIVLNANSATNGATVVTPDANTAANGVAHAIDRVMAVLSVATVLTPMGVTVNYGTSPATVGGGSTSDTNDNDFDLLAAMIRVTGQALVIIPNSSPLPDFTILQPTDGVMRAYLLSLDASLTTETLCFNYINTLSSNPTPTITMTQLTELVQYHVIPGRYLTTDMTDGKVLATNLTGKSVTVGVAGSVYTIVDLNTGVTDPTITTKDIQTNSGILHTINGVLRSN